MSDYAQRLLAAENEYLRDRAADIRDLGRRLLRHLACEKGTPLSKLPAGSVLVARELFPADFVSLGTNDLTQFLLASDRNALELSADYAILHPAVLRAIKMVADAGARVDKPVSICGEAAADPALTEIIVGLGITDLSMSPAASVRVRKQIRSLCGRTAAETAQDALAYKGASSARIER